LYVSAPPKLQSRRKRGAGKDKDREKGRRVLGRRREEGGVNQSAHIHREAARVVSG
jgi:hypothetical protein